MNAPLYSIGHQYRGRVYRQLPDSVYPGWYLQFFNQSDLTTVQLHLEPSASLRNALIEAAGFLGCKLDELQVEGEPWSRNAIEAD